MSSLGSSLLATALTKNHSLHLIDLQHNRIGSDGILPWLGRMLRTNGTLCELKLTHNAIGDRKASELLAALAPPPTTEAEQIKRSMARRRTEAIASFSSKPAVAMKLQSTHEESFNTVLTTLLLGNTGISDEAASQLGSVLRGNTTLTYLDIASNNFTTSGHIMIAAGLSQNTCLRYLNYNDNRMEQSAGITLVLALKTHPRIETALFQDCWSGALIGMRLAELLKETTTFQTIDLVVLVVKWKNLVDITNVSCCAVEPLSFATTWVH